jgi:LysR family transcriptional regulator, nitrogen assimilation regulatory protein
LGKPDLDTRRLQFFAKIVDTGSLTRAADILHIAQPALSQQIAALEAHFKQKLLIRSKQGVTPTEAGRALYRHAQIILRQMEQAQSDVARSAADLSGAVSVGLAPYSTASTLSVSLLRSVRAKFPAIIPYINENFGSVLSELVMNGRMDMALIYSAGPMKGVRFTPLLFEELFLIAPPGTKLLAGNDETVPLGALEHLDFLLPSRIHFLRKFIDASFARLRLTPHVVGEIESVQALASAVFEGIGATILPWSAASRMSGAANLVIRRITNPTIKATISMCVSDNLPMSDPAVAVHELLLGLVARLIDSGEFRGVKATQPAHKSA